MGLGGQEIGLSESNEQISSRFSEKLLAEGLTLPSDTDVEKKYPAEKIYFLKQKLKIHSHLEKLNFSKQFCFKIMNGKD